MLLVGMDTVPVPDTVYFLSDLKHICIPMTLRIHHTQTGQSYLATRVARSTIRFRSCFF